jgi:hypothetical protein
VKMRKSGTKRILLATGLVCLTLCVPVAANAQERPNVVIMLGDNVGYGDKGAYGAGETTACLPCGRLDSLLGAARGT